MSLCFVQISNIVAAANSQKVAFQRRWDHLKERMRIWKIPKEVRLFKNIVLVWRVCKGVYVCVCGYYVCVHICVYICLCAGRTL